MNFTKQDVERAVGNLVRALRKAGELIDTEEKYQELVQMGKELEAAMEEHQGWRIPYGIPPEVGDKALALEKALLVSHIDCWCAECSFCISK